MSLLVLVCALRPPISRSSFFIKLTLMRLILTSQLVLRDTWMKEGKRGVVAPITWLENGVERPATDRPAASSPRGMKRR